MTRRTPPSCDVPGCDAPRARTHRLCRSCWGRLPGEIRVGINEAHHQRRIADWRRLRDRAAAFLNLPAHTAGATIDRYVRERVTPERAFVLQAQLLGERG